MIEVPQVSTYCEEKALLYTGQCERKKENVQEGPEGMNEINISSSRG